MWKREEVRERQPEAHVSRVHVVSRVQRDVLVAASERRNDGATVVVRVHWEFRMSLTRRMALFAHKKVLQMKMRQEVQRGREQRNAHTVLLVERHR